jgi:general secretion pathway protein E
MKLESKLFRNEKKFSGFWDCTTTLEHEGNRPPGNAMNLSQYQIISMVILFLAWILLFVVAPARAFQLGLIQEDPPLFFKLRPFRVIQVLALAGMVALGYTLPADWFNRNVGDLAAELMDANLGALIGLAGTLLLLFAFPEMTARQRLARDESAGEFRTPMLVLFRWVWLGVVLLAGLGFLGHLPVLEEFIAYPVGIVPGVALAAGGALLFIIWWGVPGMMVARLAEQEDPHAITALPTVRWWGLPAWLMFGLKRGFRSKNKYESREHKLCPTCMRPIDLIEMYDSLRFDVCPHCKELIPPVFSLEEYIRHYSDLVREMNEVQSDGKKRGRVGRHESDIVQRILRGAFSLALSERATDLHFVCEGDNFMVRARTDGMLYTMLELHEALMRSVISALKVQANLDITERRKPQDGSFKVNINDKNVDIRINTSPSSGGETASLRLLYRHEVLGSLEKSGMTNKVHREIVDYIQRPHGLILVTGPTGSGKSTTLYNALATIADGKRNIITLEDPIEYKIDGLTQMQVEPKKNFTFVSGLRSILRQDPDVIMVGEIRDGETAKMTIDAAMTGHLVFSTLHTIDTSTCIGRLSDLGVDAHRHAEALLLILAQRLVRLNCEMCVEEYEMTAEELEAVGLPGGPERLILKRSHGCPRCHETGYFEREGIYEILAPNDRLREMIGQQVNSTELKRESRRMGMRTLQEDGLAKAILGRTTIEEVLRVTA